MPSKSSTNKKKAKAAAIKQKSNAANKDDLTGLDDLLNDSSQMSELEHEAKVQAGLIARTGAENARIGMAGFSQVTRNPQMFAEAMGMLNDANAVKEAESMMNDPEFKKEISKYMGQLRQDPQFLGAMEAAQKKFQELMADPEKLEELQKQYQNILGPGGAPPGDLAALTGAKAPEQVPEQTGEPGSPEVEAQPAAQPVRDPEKEQLAVE